MVQNDVIQEGVVSFSLCFNKAKDPFHKSVLKAVEQAILSYRGGCGKSRGDPDLPRDEGCLKRVPLLPKVKTL